MTTSMRCSAGSELLPVSGWLSTRRDDVEGVGIDLLDGRERDLQVVDHRAVLGAPDDAAVRQRDRRPPAGAPSGDRGPSPRRARRGPGCRACRRAAIAVRPQSGQRVGEIERWLGRAVRPWRVADGWRRAGCARLSKLTSASQSLTARYSWPAPVSGSGSVQARNGFPSMAQSIVPPALDDREVVASSRFDLDVDALGLAAAVVLLLPANDATANCSSRRRSARTRSRCSSPCRGRTTRRRRRARA